MKNAIFWRFLWIGAVILTVTGCPVLTDYGELVGLEPDEDQGPYVIEVANESQSEAVLISSSLPILDSQNPVVPPLLEGQSDFSADVGLLLIDPDGSKWIDVQINGVVSDGRFILSVPIVTGEENNPWDYTGEYGSEPGVEVWSEKELVPEFGQEAYVWRVEFAAFGTDSP